MIFANIDGDWPAFPLIKAFPCNGQIREYNTQAAVTDMLQS